MKITYLGHAGFYVESESSVIIMDPWLSRYGAFDSAWFQFPKNSHMIEYVLNHFDSTHKDKYIYVSHEHKDHFDIEFLKMIKKRNFKFILANFHRSIVKEQLEAVNYQCDGIISLNYEEEFTLKDGNLRLFVLDAELDCDSAILVQADSKSFLNINDCKLHEKLEKIVRLHGKIDVFAAQFSGAIWHPVCYDMPLKDYQRVSLKKRMNKFSIVARAIETVNPTFYIPSAGPPCFLDPMLAHINFEKINIFPKAPEYLRYLDKHCKATDTIWPEIMPGDILDVNLGKFIHLDENRVEEQQYESYIKSYANEYKDYFQLRETENKKVNPQAVFVDLKRDLEEKMKNVNLVNVKVHAILYWGISDYSDIMYRIDLTNKTITTTKEILDPNNYWKIEAPAWQVNKVLIKEMNWPDFVLTFRVKLKRNPDLYDVVTHGFVALDAIEIGRFCDLVERFHANNKDRIVVEFEGKRYSILRWCPHLGGDLSSGWLDSQGCWVCPRHQWHFDLRNSGQCITSTETIDAICLDDQNINQEKEKKLK
ncbi:CMP-N-acetylneuraminate monooxygenase [Legionella santicrucis]|uniref:CMP-N-acetylneuraminate monooxygenase n=1 Tax=Legionella santicrucis TaxID=45074 RepID=A0A0W0ZBM6_9GAMM|nr:Rieske 2Fe-2S domain-containing protein [Legionella santicrucis]KTD66573.1 CMP-N-acetylneuraminate monooxygenase [Legionella santicrucis]